MGQIVGAAIVSHHPGLMQSEEFRVLQGNGTDSDLIAGYERVRARIDAVRPDVLMIFDTHWFTTGYHLIDGGARYSGRYISDEMPWYLYGVPYDYAGCPPLARLVEQVVHLASPLRTRSLAGGLAPGEDGASAATAAVVPTSAPSKAHEANNCRRNFIFSSPFC